MNTRCCCSLLGNAQVEADNGSLVDDVVIASDGTVEDVGDEKCGLIASSVFKGGGIPGAVDLLTCPGFGDLALAVQDDEAASFGIGEFAVGGWQAADDDPAAFKFDEGCGEADAVGTGGRRELGKDALGAVGRNLDDGRAGALQVGTVVEIADEDVALYKVADALLHDGNAIGVDIAIAGDGRTHFVDGGELVDED